LNTDVVEAFAAANALYI